MSNKWILLAYAVLFFAVVFNYDSYSDNTYLVALAGVTLSVAGIGAWVWSVQPKRDKE
jgi:nicotinamide riboside transporter PnuC